MNQTKNYLPKTNFESGQSLEDLIYDWWSDVFSIHYNDEDDVTIDSLLNKIENWLPTEELSSNEENVLLEKIKSKIRKK